MNTFGQSWDTTENNFFETEDGGLYDSSYIMYNWIREGDSHHYSQMYRKGATLLHIDVFNEGEHTERITLANGNYLEVTYTIYTHNDEISGEVFDGMDWNFTGYNADGTTAGVGSAGRYITSGLEYGQYLAWTSGGADLTFYNGLAYDEDDDTYFGYEYGTAIIPSEYMSGVVYPVGGTFDTALPIGNPIAFAQSRFEGITTTDQLDDETVASTNFIAWINGSTQPKETPGEDTDAGEEGRPGGGGGTGYLYEDNGIPSLPTLSVANSGFCGIYHVTGPQLASLSQFLWGTSFYTNVLKNFASPAENIIMFGIVPWSSFNASAHNISIGNVDTGISAPRLNTTLYELNCGTISVGEPTDGTFADYEPYTRYWIFLPYIGMVDLPADDVALAGQITVIYHFDVFSGSCVAFVRCKTPKGWFTLGEYNGNLLTNLPISGSNFLSMYMNLAGSVLGAATSAASGNYVGAAVDLASGIISAKPEYMRSGSISNVAGMLGHQKPFLVRAVPEIARTTHFRTMQGYASKLEGLVGSHTGYLRTQYTNLSGVSGATDEELAEIKQLLESGIYV